MSEVGKKLKTVLEGYAKFLRDRDLAPPKHQPHLVRWVREFLLFAEEHGGYTFEQTLDLFLAAIGKRVGIKPWQIQQAAQETISATQDERGLQMDEKLKEQEERAVETAQESGENGSDQPQTATLTFKAKLRKRQRRNNAETIERFVGYITLLYADVICCH